MTPQEAIIKFRLRLNKLHSQDYDNIEDWIAVSVINKAALEWVRKQIHGINQTQEGDEESKIRIDDLQNLLVEKELKGSQKKVYYESDKLPEDYLSYKRLLLKANKDGCKGTTIDSSLVEEANVPVYLADWSMQPSFDWGQTFHTLVGDKIRVYTNDDFTVDSLGLMYYRKPKRFDIAGYKHEDGRESKNQDLEFREIICEIILDEAASIAAGDIELINAFQITKQRADNNN